jgi:glucose dehydrogenase
LIITNNTIKKCFDFAGKKLHAPEQRMLIGATALVTQPWIDSKNNDVDKDTRMISVARTIGKVIACAVVGVAVRYAGIGLVRALCKHTPILNKNGTKVIGLEQKKGLLVPDFSPNGKVKQVDVEQFKDDMERYIKALGTTIATVAMFYTNFSLDAPATKYLTNKCQKIMEKYIEKKKANEVQK